MYSQEYYFLGEESIETRLLVVKCTEEHILKKRSISPMIKILLQNIRQELLVRIIITYSRQYTFVFPEKAFSCKRNNRNKILGISAKARVLGEKSTENTYHTIAFFPQ